MKRIVVVVAFILAFAALTVGGSIWHRYLRTPPLALEPLPSHLIALDTPAGRRLLAESDADADYDALRTNFVAQTRRAYCGVASALVALNASGASLDQESLFADADVELDPLKVSFVGMSLREFGDLLRAHGVHATVVHASSTDIDGFRRAVSSNLHREGDLLLVNYERELLGQKRMGHISPVAAYDADSDRVLILDVAAHRYPHVWVTIDTLWEAMNAPVNEQTTRTRGYVTVAADPLAGEPARR
ncbi:phytochelatin synthase family protein [Lysobacter panacisoli]|uniref:glutathione gamma-glutamylcysteinyltransferase n=1 Tax=Lysobacter panacisoli TaxID=1255263 RepID=A0ABP9L6A6_9GAMM|nr:phytochelatin synthase family protein [Lysobacter panacisoli]